MEPILVDAWQELSAVPIAVAVAGLTVQFFKIFLGDRWHGPEWRRLSAAVAVVWMIGVTLFGAGLDGLALLLALVNGMIAGVGASGGFDMARTTVERFAEANE